MLNNFIQPYQPHWKTEFEALKNVFITALQDVETDIQHVGSTAIPGLPAKPILDIDIIIDHKSQLPLIAQQLEQLGYHNKGEQGIAGRFAFRQRMDTAPFTQPSRLWQAHHLYVCFADSLALKNHLLFRDVLIRQPHLVAAYGQLKTALVNEKGMTRDKYTQRKTEFIVQILATHGLSTSEIEAIRMANQ